MGKTQKSVRPAAAKRHVFAGDDRRLFVLPEKDHKSKFS
jgi:hypothetical protein